ncbi:MAG: hypothetical protein WCC35_06240, partial [Bradyrhizobium sp.]
KVGTSRRINACPGTEFHAFAGGGTYRHPARWRKNKRSFNMAQPQKSAAAQRAGLNQAKVELKRQFGKDQVKRSRRREYWT